MLWFPYKVPTGVPIVRSYSCLVINNPVLEYIFLNQMYASIVKMEKKLLENSNDQEGKENSL
jgi:hypothetical protein